VTAIFVFAHQDDEFGVLATIERLVRSGAKVHCVYFTDGAYGNQSTERRNMESLRVLASLGIAPSNVYFIGQRLRIPDGSLYAYLMPAFKGLREWIERIGPVDEMYLPAWEGGHQDHDAAHLIGVITSTAFGLLNSTFQFSLYNGHRLIGPIFRVMSPLPDNGPSRSEHIPWRRRLAYSLLCLSYPSQWKTWLGLFPFVLCSYLKHGFQREQPVSLHRLFESPHPGRLLYERRNFLTSKEFNDAKTRFINESGFHLQGRTGNLDGNT
jgi:LmbE family N-acetylglucosaminyl deacetylase